MTGSPWGIEWAGRLEERELDSQALRGNPLGDPHRRPLWVYLPPGYDSEPERRYPAVYQIQGFTGQLDMWRNRSPLRPNFPELVDGLFARGEAPPCIVVFVDCWTSLGGSQFLDSPAVGRYHTYLCDEVVPFVDAGFRTAAASEHRGIQGKSSGGYGAMVTAMLRPDVFGALASHAGDALFELCYPLDFGPVVRALRDEYGGSFEAWRGSLLERPFGTRASDHHLLNVWAMAACYSADPDGSVRLPFDLETGRLLPEIWERWLRWDPVRMAPERSEALRSLRAIYLDAGRRDEYFLDLGAAAFKKELDRIGVREVRFELFDAGHGGIEYRYPVALAYLARHLA